MFPDGYYKVAQSGGTYIVATFFNPETEEECSLCVRDYDYSDCSRDIDDLYYQQIDKDARRKWYRKHGVICTGDTIKVVKGRKIPIGTIAVVERIYDWKDQYGRVQTTYCVFTDGRKTSISNCELLKESD